MQLLLHPEVGEDLRRGLRLLLPVELDAELGEQIRSNTHEQDFRALVVHEFRRVEWDESPTSEETLERPGQRGSACLVEAHARRRLRLGVLDGGDVATFLDDVQRSLHLARLRWQLQGVRQMGVAAMTHDGVHALARRTGRRELALPARFRQARLGVELVLYILGPARDLLHEGPGLSLTTAVDRGGAFLR